MTRHNAEDLDSSGEDHAADMLRYAIMSRPPLALGWEAKPAGAAAPSGRSIAAVREHARMFRT